MLKQLQSCTSFWHHHYHNGWGWKKKNIPEDSEGHQSVAEVQGAPSETRSSLHSPSGAAWGPSGWPKHAVKLASLAQLTGCEGY